MKYWQVQTQKKNKLNELTSNHLDIDPHAVNIKLSDRLPQNPKNPYV